VLGNGFSRVLVVLLCSEQTIPPLIARALQSRIRFLEKSKKVERLLRLNSVQVLRF